LKDKAFSTFLDQNPRFEQQPEEPTRCHRAGSPRLHQKYRKQPHAK
jgi:hypothetical protein